nr:hypothetical protein [Tanacetum cinerariifolium]
APILPDYVTEPEYPEYLVPSDAEAPIEDHPLPDDASPTALSPGYVSDSDPEEDLEKDPAEYPANEGDDDDDDDDDEEEDKEDHLAPTDSTTLHVVDSVSLVEDIEAFETDESAPTPTRSPRLRKARISIRLLPHMPASMEACIVERVHFTTPTGRFEVGESSLAAVARQAGHTLAHRVDYGFIDTVDASIYASESRGVTAVREDDRDFLRAQLSLLMRERERRYFRSMASSYEHDRDVDVLQSQRIKDEDRLTIHIQHEHDRFRELVRTAEAGSQDGPTDDGSSCRMNLLSLFSYLVWHVKYYGNGDDSHDSGTGSRRTERAACECTYNDFLKCLPLNFKGTEGVASLTQCFEKIEYVFYSSNCTMMTAKYCPKGEIKKLEIEPWNLKVKGTDVLSYNQRFQELALMCSRMFLEESNKDAIEFSTELTDQKIYSLADRQAKNKRKLDDTSRNNQNRSLSEGIMWQGPILLGLGKRKWALQEGLPKLKNNNQGNQAGNGNAVEKGLCCGHCKDKPKLQCRYGSLIDIIPTTLDHGYDIKLADDKTI